MLANKEETCYAKVESSIAILDIDSCEDSAFCWQFLNIWTFVTVLLISGQSLLRVCTALHTHGVNMLQWYGMGSFFWLLPYVLMYHIYARQNK